MAKQAFVFLGNRRVTGNNVALLGSSISQYPLAKFLKSRGVGFDYLSNKPSNLFDNVGGAFVHCELSDTDNVIWYCKAAGYQRVLSMGSDVCCRLLSIMSDQNIIDDPFVQPLSIYDGFFNKHTFKKKFTRDKNNNHFVISGEQNWRDDVENFLKKHGTCIVKPIDSYGSKGVFKLPDPINFETQINSALNESPSNTVILEQYLESDGFQICGDAYVKDSKVEFMKLGFNRSRSNDFKPLIEAFPDFEIPHSGQIKQALNQIIKEAGVKNTFLNTDIIVSNGNIHILEIALRLGGNCISDAIYFSTGRNLLDIYLYGEFVKTNHQPLHIINHMLHSTRQGFFKAEMLNRFKGCRELNLDLSEGDTLEPIIETGKTYGNLITSYSQYSEFMNALKIGPKFGDLSQ